MDSHVNRGTCLSTACTCKVGVFLNYILMFTHEIMITKWAKRFMTKVTAENPTCSLPTVLHCSVLHDVYPSLQIIHRAVVVCEVECYPKTVQETFDSVFGNIAGYKSSINPYCHNHGGLGVWMRFEGEALELLHQHLHVNNILSE